MLDGVLRIRTKKLRSAKVRIGQFCYDQFQMSAAPNTTVEYLLNRSQNIRFTGGDYNTGLLGLYNTGQLALFNTRNLKIWVWRKDRYNTRDLKILNILTDWCYSGHSRSVFQSPPCTTRGRDWNPGKISIPRFESLLNFVKNFFFDPKKFFNFGYSSTDFLGKINR